MTASIHSPSPDQVYDWRKPTEVPTEKTADGRTIYYPFNGQNRAQRRMLERLGQMTIFASGVATFSRAALDKPKGGQAKRRRLRRLSDASRARNRSQR